MRVLLLIVLVAYVPVVVTWWLAAAGYLRRLGRGPLRLPRVAAWPAGRPAPCVAFVLACHNEAANVETCLRRLRQQTYPSFRIVVANDRSTDDTGAIVRRVAAEDPRVTLVDIMELPPGWLGKAHALTRAVAGCPDDYFVFVDCDVTLTPDALTSAMSKVCEGDLALLSFWPHLHLRSFWERVLTPPALLLLGMWSLRGTAGGDVPGGARGGNGQFLLFRRDAYEAVGGHAAVAAELTEDTILAERVHAAGLRSWFGVGSEVYAAERVGDFTRSANALARVLIGTLARQSRVWLAMQVLLANVGPLWILPLALICLALGVETRLAASLAALALLHWGGMMAAARATLGLLLPQRGPLVWFPIGSLLLIGILVWCAGLLAGHGTLRWGPTRYRVKGTRVQSGPAA